MDSNAFTMGMFGGARLEVDISSGYTKLLNANNQLINARFKDVNFSGNLYQNGILFTGSGVGGGSSQWSDGSNNNIYYNSGNVGIGTTYPTTTLDLTNGIIRASHFTPSYILPSICKMFTMSGTSYLDIALGNTNAKGFLGGFTDGTYIYLVPNKGSIFTRVEINNYTSNGISYLDVAGTGYFTSASGFSGGFTDGVYAYLIPDRISFTTHDVFTRVALNNFTTNGISYLALSTFNSLAKGYRGGFTDGRYAYLIPGRNNINNSKVILSRVDLTNFTSTGISYLDMSIPGNSDVTFYGGFTDGQYGYLTSLRSILTRIDLNNFTTNGISYLNLPTSNGSYTSGFTDGRYGYILPIQNEVARIDLTNFTTSGITMLNVVNPNNTNAQGFKGGFTDGRYGYLAPNIGSLGNYHGNFTRIDLLNFTTNGIKYMDISVGNTNVKGCGGAFTDGKYAYMVPYETSSGVNSGILTRVLVGDIYQSGY